MKNKKSIVGIIIVCVVQSAVGFEKKPVLINRHKMVEQSRKIRTMISRHRYMVTGLGIMGAVSEISFLMPFFTGNPAPESAKPVSVNAPSDTTWSQAIMGFPAAMWDGVKTTGSNALWLFTTPDGLKRFTLAALGIGSQIGAMHIMSKLAERIQHPDTLRWYLYAHVPYDSAFDVMKAALKKLEDPALSHEQMRYNMIFLELAAKRLTHYVEDVGAYMMYKSRELEKAQRLMVKFVIDDVVESHNAWLQKMYEQFSAPVPQDAILRHLVNAYEADLVAKFNHFSMIEGESREQKRAMKELLSE